MSACAGCLRRTRLIGLLSGRIGDRLGKRDRVRGLLTLGDTQLVEALGDDAGNRARDILDWFDEARARDEIRAAGLHAVCRHSPVYPESLGDLEDPPAVLHSTAPPDRLAELLASPVAAVVGARRASAYGLEVARALGRGLGAAGIAVVSGLALGIDAASHRGALDGAGRTVAVLGCGADRPYPRANHALYDRVRTTGAIISELPPGHPPARWAFPARNRIMAGLAAMTVVVEAAERSGSLITVGFAEDLGREVGVVPGRVTARVAAGSNRLLRDGATPVLGAEDVLDSLLGVGWREKSGESVVEDGSPMPAAEQLEPLLASVLRAVEDGDALSDSPAAPRVPAAELRAALGRLELLGLVRRDGLGSYQRVVAA